MLRVLLNKIHLKASGSRGESLVEVLVSIVISGLAILMLATTVAASVNVNMSSERVMNAYYDASNGLAEKGASTSSDATGSVKIKQGDALVTLSGSRDSVPVNYYYDENVGGTIVASYEE